MFLRVLFLMSRSHLVLWGVTKTATSAALLLTPTLTVTYINTHRAAEQSELFSVTPRHVL